MVEQPNMGYRSYCIQIASLSDVLHKAATIIIDVTVQVMLWLLHNNIYLSLTDKAEF